MNKKAVIYARVSTDEQKEKGYSLPHQIDECRRYAKQKGIEVVEEIKEDYSGATLNRPGFMALQKTLNEGRANAVIVLTADRLSRNYIDGLVVRDQWEKARIGLHYVDTGQAQDSFQSVIGDMFSYAKGHFERKDIARRTSNGRISKAKDGKPVMNGVPPFGYGRIGRLRDAEMVINPIEAEIIRKIFKWYTSNEDGGPLSMWGISYRLDEMGIRPRCSHHWNPSSVRKILINPIYAGKTHYHKTMMDDNNRTIYRPREEWIEINVPHLALIDQKTFNQAQARTKLNKERSQRNRKGEYLLSGHIRCNGCGFAMFGIGKWHKPNKYYRCGSHGHKGIHCNHYRHNLPSIKADQVVWDWLSSLLEDETTLKRGISAMSKQRTNEIKPKRHRLETITFLLGKSTAKINRLIDDLSELEKGTTRDAVKEKIKTLEAEQRMLSAEKNQIESELMQIEITPEAENQILESAAQIRERLPDRSFDNMRYLIDKLNVQVIFIEENDDLILKVSCEIPGSEEYIVVPHS